MTEKEALNQLEGFLKSQDIRNPVSNYRYLHKIISEHPSLIDESSILFQRALLSDKNNYISLRVAYALLTNTVQNHPQLADNIFNLFKTALRSGKNDYVSLEVAYKTFAGTIKKRPELAPKILKLFKTALQSDKNGYPSINTAYQTLAKIIKEKPEYTQKCLDLFKDALSAKKNCYASMNVAYQTLADIIKDRPELSDKVFELFKTALSSQKNDAVSSEIAYESLGKIIKAHPELTEKCLELFKLPLLSDKNDDQSLIVAYKTLAWTIKKQPEVAPKIFKLFKIALKSDKNKGSSLKTAYEVLGGIVAYRSKLTEQSLELFKTALQSDKNKNRSLGKACETLADIVEKRPRFAKDVFQILEDCENITKCRPDDPDEREYTDRDDHFNTQGRQINFLYSLNRLLLTVMETHPELARRTLFVASKYPTSDMFLHTFKLCMRRVPLEEAISKYPNMEQNLRIAYNGRFASSEEFHYALSSFDKSRLANSDIFRKQQHVMNVLFCLLAQDLGISKKDALTFRKKNAPKAVKELKTGNHWWLTEASFNGASLFGTCFPSYIKTIQNYYSKNPGHFLFTVHDAVYWLPKPMSEDSSARLAAFIRKHIIYQNAEHKDAHRPINELQIITHNWKALETKLQEKNGTPEVGKLKYADVLSICKQVKYKNQQHEGFALEAAKHGVPESFYHTYEDIYLAGLKVPEPFNSKKQFKLGKYVGRFLPRDDVRVGFFGDYTNCCQRYGGMGNACAVSTVKHPFSQLFVVEDDKGKIVAGSWAWENTEGKYREVCFDNIETLGELKDRPEINQIYEQVGKYLTKQQNCRRVTIGLGYQDADVSGYKETKSVCLPSLYGRNYSDAQHQVLLAENPNAMPLDQMQEMQPYIRDVCDLDVEAMKSISKAVFPNSDKGLQTPENMAGFVIEDRQKGVVGYCLYDKQEKEIYDMAVLPEYRTDQNASSSKLLLEMIKEVKKTGGHWKAQLRDKTTLRYMETMASRGIVKIKRHGVDHVMSDGSKVISVTFEAVRDDKRDLPPKERKSAENQSPNLIKPNKINGFGGGR